jgi:succinyl-diaminopimelate desuccinylase
MNLDELVLSQKDEMLKTLQGMVKIDSVESEPQAGAPFGKGVQECLEYSLKACKDMGFSVTNMDNYTGWCEYGTGKDMVLVLGHLDVVPIGEGWNDDPFSGRIEDGKIFGRGTMDDKGPIVAALYGLKALKESGLPITKRVRLMFGTNEETRCADMQYYREHGGEMPVMGFTPDGEYPLINGEKGILRTTYRVEYKQTGDLKLVKVAGGSAPNVVPAKVQAEFTCSAETAKKLVALSNDKVTITACDGGVKALAIGHGAHGSTPEKGKNAIAYLMQVMDKMPLDKELATAVHFLVTKIGEETTGKSLGIALHDEASGNLSLNLGTIEGDDKAFTVQVDCRFPVTKKVTDCEPIQRKEFESAGYKQTAEVHSDPLYIPADSELVQKLLKVYHEKSGLEAKAKSIGGGTYAKSIPNILAFGPIFPGDEVREHQPNEYMEVERLIKNAQIFAEAIYQLAK